MNKLTPFSKILIAAGIIGSLMYALYATGILHNGNKDEEESETISNADMPDVQLLFTLSGSNTIGSKLAPELVKSYMELKQAATSVVITKTDNDGLEQWVTGTVNNKKVGVKILSRGTKTGFQELKAHTADIAMASRQIAPDEIDDNIVNTTRKCENILALDGIAIIVNEENTLTEIKLSDVARVFSGEVTNWSQLGGNDLPIQLYARDNNSGTFDCFNDLVLKKNNTKMSDNAQRFESSKELANKVALDKGGIGFISASETANEKVLRVFEQGTTPLLPSMFTISTEDYLISRRLYLYTTLDQKNQQVEDFVEFCGSSNVQKIVDDMGFVSLNIECNNNIAITAQAPAEYKQNINGACRLSLNIRFKSGKSEIDNKAYKDMQRIVSFLNLPANQSKHILLFGFADNVGDPTANKTLSLQRANVVLQEFKDRGLDAKTFGIGSQMPVADNTSEQGREKNRRVEIWIQ